MIDFRFPDRVGALVNFESTFGLVSKLLKSFSLWPSSRFIHLPNLGEFQSFSMPVASPLVAALLAATSQRVPTAACTSPRARGVVTSRSSLSSGPFEELRAAVTAVLDDRKSAWASLTLRAEEIAGLPFRTAGDGQLEARRLADSLQQDAQRFAAEAARLATLPRKRLESRKVVVDTSAIAAMMMAEARALAMLPARKASEAQAETRGLAVEAASKAMRLTVEAQRLAELSGHKAAEAQALAAEARREAKRLASLPYKRAAEAQVEARRFVLEAQARHSSTPLHFLPLLLTAPEASFLPRGCRSSHSCSQDTIAKPSFVHQCMPVFLTQAVSISLHTHVFRFLITTNHFTSRSEGTPLLAFPLRFRRRHNGS